jgi:hypothetical protein
MAVEKYTTKNEKFSVVDFKDGLLKVSVEKQKFKDIMDEIAEKAEIKIIFNYSGDEEITTNFDYLPLEKGLRQLLREKNYAFKYQTGEGNDSKNPTSLMKVYVFSKSDEAIVTKYKGFDRNGYPDNTRRTIPINELQNQIREKLDEALALHNFPDIKKQFREAMDKIKETGIYKEETAFEGVADVEEKIKEALQGNANTFIR